MSNKAKQSAAFGQINFFKTLIKGKNVKDLPTWDSAKPDPDVLASIYTQFI